MTAPKTSFKPVRGKTIATNSLLTLGTGALIIGLNILFVPLMLHAFGTELYGVLSVTWMVLANLSWLDLGFSRASAKYVSHELALGQLNEAVVWTWTAVGSQMILGLIGAFFLWFLAPWLVDKIHVQHGNRDLVIMTLRLFAFSIPLDFANKSLSGVLQAGQRFDWINGLSVLSTLSTFGAYTVGILRGADFRAIVYILFAMRFVNLIAAFVGARRVLPSLNSFSYIKQLGNHYWSHAVTMVRYGSWIAAASVLGGLLLYFDQWILSLLLGIALLPFYTVPMNLLNRLSIFPSSLTGTLFPAFSALKAKNEWARIDDYFVRSHRYLLTVIVPGCFLVYVWGGEFLRLWIGASFAAHAGFALKILTLGMVVSLLAPVSGALLEAVGRPDVLVKLYLVELPFNIAFVWYLTKHYGVPGAALSFVIRTICEVSALWVIVYTLLPLSKSFFLKEALVRGGLWVGVFGVMSYVMRDATIYSFNDIALTLLALAAYGLSIPRYIFDGKDRALVADFFRRKRNKLIVLKEQSDIVAGG